MVFVNQLSVEDYSLLHGLMRLLSKFDQLFQNVWMSCGNILFLLDVLRKIIEFPLFVVLKGFPIVLSYRFLSAVLPVKMPMGLLPGLGGQCRQKRKPIGFGALGTC